MVTIASIVAIIYFFLLPQPMQTETWFMSLFEICLFFLSAFFVSTAIEKFRRTDLRADFRRKEQMFIAETQKFVTARQKAEKEIRLRDEFLSIASHELKTPLTSMLLKLQLVLHNIKNVSLANFSVATLLKNVEIAEQQSKRLSSMINDLLNVSLITTGRMNLEVKHEDLVPIVKEVIEEFAERLASHNIPLDLETVAQAPVYIDKLRMQQVLSNLLSNAIKYGNDKPIQIRISKGSHVSVAISDQGIGISSKEQEKIFTLFDRGTINHEIKGLGVGLYIANQIVKAHKGTLSVRSKLAQGSTFTIKLPLTQNKKS
ncbi:sensor histidine kinase [Candidatus Microgenomates bacterium]|nr:MAG: sensor histidine kinase [Candidatus Microgenomates bacterium]